jgi:uncharacterized protein (TIGR02099 family)
VRRTLRRIRRLLGWCLLAGVVLAALAVGLASQLLPLLARHPDAVARWLSERIDAPVALDGVQAHWNRAGPRLSLSGMRIGQAPEVLDIDSAQLQVNIYSGLWPGVPLTELRLDGPELELHRSRDGRWRLDGFGRGAPEAAKRSQFQQLDRFGALEVRGARLRFHDAITGRQRLLPRIDARMQRAGRQLRLGAHVYGEVPGAVLRLGADLSPNGQAGTVYLEGRGQDWAIWLRDLTLGEVALSQARGDLRVWLDFAGGEPIGLQLDASMAPFALHAAIEDDQGDGRIVEQAARFAIWQMQANVQREGDAGWRAMVPSWRVVEADGSRAVDVVRRGHAQRDASGLVRVEADALALGPPLALARLVPAMPSRLRHWLDEAAPHGALESLRAAWLDAGRYRLEARLVDAGWQAVGGVPSFEGVSGALDADARALRLGVAAGVWAMRMPGVLREPFTPRVSGEIIAFDPGEGWRIDTPGLRLHEDDYDIVLAGGAQFPDDGGVLLDLRADVGEGPLVVAKRFWPVNVMPETAVRWLDTALIDGRVAHGSALVRGNLRDWPFRQGEGRFEALAELADVHVAYHPDWLPGRNVRGTARFINVAMELDLAGEVGGAQVASARGGVADFGDSILALDVRGAGSGSALLDLLRKSPLHETHGELMDGVSLGGRGEVALALHIPLEQHLGEPKAEGQVDVARMDMRDVDRGLDFEGASGRVRFSDRGFLADELSVGFGGTLGALSIAAGAYTSRSEHLVEASLRGHFPAGPLVQSNARSRWLAPWLGGEADWNLQLTVPEPSGETRGVPQLRIRSDLAGVSIRLPAPLRKGAADRMPLDLSLALREPEVDIDLRLGGLLRLHGHSTDDGFTGTALFGDALDAAPPRRGLHVAGQIPVLDVAAWGGVVAGMDGGGGALHLASADLFIGELNLLGRPFRETRLTMQRDAQRFTFGFAGDALAGELAVPLEGLAQKGITARLERLHWPEMDAADAAQEAAQASTPAAPGLIPPIHLESTDTRFGGARLGSVWLETWPTAHGLHVERFDAHSPALDIKAKGDWQVVGGRESTTLALDFSSRDAGAMLEALGFLRLIESSGTHGHLALAWPGAPGAFEWDGADGKLELSVGQGRVLEVEPGAGRLFGLLSLTEIPRRLSLDFSDFLKSGFAFNQMAGSFRIERGNAITDDFQINAPSAEIRLRGRTGLKARDYDQTLEVLPKAGSMLPAIGALAAGPAGAAVGAVAQAVLRQPLKDMTRTVYRVAGPWDAPKIEPEGPGAARNPQP